MATITRTTCSNCSIDLTVDPTTQTVSAVIPSNGRRGSLHVPAREVSADLYGDADLLEWECPACEHPDSFDPNF